MAHFAPLQRRAPTTGDNPTSSGHTKAALSRVGPGRALDPGVRARLSGPMGSDLSDVRVHDDPQSAAFAEEQSARAVTIGRHVLFASGEYRPGTLVGDVLIAHELAHAEQQRDAHAISRTGANEPQLEHDAGRSAVAALLGRRATPAMRSRLRLSRCRRDSGRQTANPSPSASTATASTGSARPTAQPLAAAEDWNFTPAEYQNLVQGGQQLQAAVDSGWFPARLQANLIALLNYVLDPRRRPASTEGVNIRDLYHGHVGIPRGTAMPPALRTRMQTFFRVESEVNQRVFGVDYADVTAANLPAYTRETQTNLLPAAQAVLEEALRVPGAVVIYHTFELSGPPMSPGEPRRNILVPLSTNVPEPYRPPDPNNASSWTNQYQSVLQFSFLVDSGGSIHIRTGSTAELSTVTGQPSPL